jgi:hypothetical protein
MYDLMPEVIKDSLDRYAKDKCPTGGFLYAVLSNNLFEAFGAASENNREALFDIVSYIYNELPSTCWGDPEKVRRWLASRQPEGEPACIICGDIIPSGMRHIHDGTRMVQVVPKEPDEKA